MLLSGYLIAVSGLGENTTDQKRERQIGNGMGITQMAARIKNKYKEQITSAAFIMLFGIVVHLYMFSNKFFNYFEMGNILADMSFSQADTLGLGRWFLPFASNFITGFSMPVINGLICIIFMTISSVMLSEMLRLKGTVYRCLFGFAWVTFPGMASVFSYGVNSDALCLSIFLAVLAVYVSWKFKWGIIGGIIALGASVGIYQPFLAVAIAAVFCILFLQVMQENFVQKDFLIRSVKYAVMLLLGFLFYYVMLKLCLTVSGIELRDYHGIDEMTSFTPKGLAKGFVYSYGYFLANLFSREYIYTWGRVLWNVLGAVAFFVSVFAISKKRIKNAGRKEKVVRISWLVVMSGLIPLGLNAAPFLMGDRVGNGVDRYMLFSIILLWGLLLKNLEMMEMDKAVIRGMLQKVAYWLGIGSVCIAVFSSGIICNQAYQRMESMTRSVEAIMNRMAARIEQLPEWNRDMPVYFVNPRGLINDNYTVIIPEYDSLTNLPGTRYESRYSERAIVKYLEVYLHFPVNIAEDGIKQALDENSTVKNMPSYPARDSIQVIDGVIVVKISDGEE